ncbi:MAG TPA: pre-peptidase C-terminal domain-containing protein [Longimicrobium sp.]|nr:pre-peptidase C-terminal domain-containing protein [Longimicrobium sp.]
MRRMQCVAAAAAAWALLAAGSAQAQRTTQQRTIRPGQTVNATLTDSDPRTTERGRFHVYTFQARRGQNLVATMRSKDFDAYLTIGRVVSGITDAMKTDDDRGGNTDARIRFSVPEDGSYLVVAQALTEEGRGAYTLQLENAPVATTAAARPITVGQPVTGTLAETDAVEDDDTYYDTYTFTAQRGQRFQIDMQGDFDTFLNFGKMDDGQFTSIRTDDDGAGEGTNSRLRVTITEPGEYVIRANSVGAGETGPYTLTLTARQGGATTATPRAIEPNAQVTGTLDDSDPQGDDDSYYDYWTYQGRQGERLRISMESEAFDTYLSLGTLQNGEFTEIESNDDGSEGTNSVLEVELPSSGTFVIRAKALSGENEGNYTLKVEPQR